MSSDPKVNYLNARKQVRTPSDLTSNDLFQVPNHEMIIYKEYSQKYTTQLVNEAKNNPPEGWKPTKEQPRPRPSTVKMYQVHSIIQDEWKELSDLIPRGVPLSKSLAIDQEHTISWSQPAKRDLFRAAPMNRIVHTSRFDPVCFNQRASEFKSYASKNRLNQLNVSPYSFTVEFVKITPKQHKELVQCMIEKKDCNLTLYQSQDIQKCVDYPALFTVSNGCTSISFNFGWFEYKRGVHDIVEDVTFFYSKLPEEVVGFLESLPLLFSNDANQKLRMLRNSLKELFDVDIKFQGFDIASLAIFAGCRVDDLSLFSLSAIVDGKPFPHGIHWMDNLWIRDSSEMPTAVKSYLNEKMYVLDNVYSTLIGLCLRQMFPDPDITLSITDMTQLEFIYWFSEFTGRALIDSDHTKSVLKCATQEEMIKKIADPDNKFVQPLCNLLNAVPVAQEGGARYLHTNRKYFVEKQYDVIKRLDFHLFTCKVPNQDVDIDNLGFRFQYRREMAFDNSGVPASDVGLLPSPEFANTIYSLDLNDIVKLERQFDRDLVPALEEWGRLNVLKIERLLTKVRGLSTDQLAEFWIPKVRVYEMLRGIYFRLTGEYITVVDLDRVIATKVKNVRNHHEELEAKRELYLQSMRVDFMNQRAERSREKVGLHQSVMRNIPGSSNKKNILKRRKNTARLARRRDESSEVWMGRVQLKKAKQAGVLANLRNDTLASGSSGSTSKGSGQNLTTDDLRNRLGNHHADDLRNRLEKHQIVWKKVN